jgi:hypothetical protein
MVIFHLSKVKVGVSADDNARMDHSSSGHSRNVWRNRLGGNITIITIQEVEAERNKPRLTKTFSCCHSLNLL